MGTCACCHMLPLFPLSDQTWVSMARLFRTRTSRFREPAREKRHWRAPGAALGLSPDLQLDASAQGQPAESQQETVSFLLG